MIRVLEVVAAGNGDRSGIDSDPQNFLR